MYWRTQGGTAAPFHQMEIKKKSDYVGTIVSELLCNLPFSLDQPWKSTDD